MDHILEGALWGVSLMNLLGVYLMCTNRMCGTALWTLSLSALIIYTALIHEYQMMIIFVGYSFVTIDSVIKSKTL